MDLNDLSRELAESLKEKGWHLNVSMQKCPEGCRSKRYEKGAKSFCPYCGEELVVDDAGLKDIEAALRDVEGIEELFDEEVLDEEETESKETESREEQDIIEIDIPGVVDRRGRLSIIYSQTEDGKQTSQDDLLYEHWGEKEEEIPLRKISISARIDLKEIFGGSEIEATEVREDT
jgi:hypothetical protein